MRYYYSTFLFLAFLMFSMCTAPQPSEEADPFTELMNTVNSSIIVDLTYTFDTATIYWPTEEGFVLNSAFAGYTEKGYYYSANSFIGAEHGGTHLDAPVHFAEGRQSADAIPLKTLIGSGVRIDVSSRALDNPDYLITVDDILDWEEENGEIREGTIVLFHTGYGKFWPDRSRYMGTDLRGTDGVANLHFPGIAPETARWLVDNRTITAVGIDTPSIDFGQSSLYETHRVLFENDIPAFENVAHTDQLPGMGFLLVALPMKIGGGSGGPLRIIALIP